MNFGHGWKTMFNKIIDQIRHHFGIQKIEDWQTVKPEWLLRFEGVGPVTLDHIRLYLAARNLTLLEDQTPEFWNEKLATVRIGKTLSYDDLTVHAPFRILIDTREQLPFTFDGISADVTETPSDMARMVKIGEIDQSEIKLAVPTRFKSLGNSMGDYSIEGYQGECNVERKSIEDAHGTFLGWGERRERFETELENLAAMEAAAVVVECSFGQLLAEAPSRGKKTASENRKILHRQVLSWQQTYRVPWIFCDTRRLAEITTYRIFHRFWKKRIASKPVVVDTVFEMEIEEL